MNAFVHSNLDETVFIRQPPGFERPGTVLRLRKALYGLRRSPLLWQTTLTQALRELEFKEVPQEPCVLLRDGIVVFFYVDDIVLLYRKRDAVLASKIVDQLSQKFEIKDLGELKWFLGIHIVRDRNRRKLWLSQASYIDKVANQYHVNLEKREYSPMAEEELLPALEIAPEELKKLYQKKVGSVLFAAVISRPDTILAASRLSRFNQNPGKQHHEAIDRLIRYLYHTRDRSICYGEDTVARSFICAGDSSFADNSIDRKSSQGYVITLFGGAVAWRANKQDTVTTSSTEAELLALSQTAKEAIYLSRLFRAFTLELDEPLKIECDNTQTIRLLEKESTKLSTKLRHVDIH